MKHKITINVADRCGRKTKVLKGAVRRLPTRLLNFLFGGYTEVYLLSPGQTVTSWAILDGGRFYLNCNRRSGLFSLSKV